MTYVRDDDEREGYTYPQQPDGRCEWWQWKPAQGFRLSGHVDSGEPPTRPTHLRSLDARTDPQDGRIKPTRQVKWLK